MFSLFGAGAFQGGLAPALRFVRDVFTYFLPAALFGYIPPHALLPANMPRAKGTKAIDLACDVQRRGMVHVKTKEECRLANETVDVWSIELPSKHAESILKYGYPSNASHCHPLTVLAE